MINKKIKNTLLIASALMIGTAVAQPTSLVEQPTVSEVNALTQFPTSPVVLNQKIPLSLIGHEINYNDLDSDGKNKYLQEIKYMNGANWHYFKDSKNVLFAIDEDKIVGIVKVHYSFKDIDTINRYKKSLESKYPNIIIQDGGKFIRMIESKRKPPVIKYDTMRTYIDSILSEAKTELASERLRFEHQSLFSEIDTEGKTVIETYIDFKVAPQWNHDYKTKSVNNIKDIIKSMEQLKSSIAEKDLDSKEYMEQAIKRKEVYIFK